MDIKETDVIKDIKEPLKEVKPKEKSKEVEPTKADKPKAKETQVKKKEKAEEGIKEKEPTKEEKVEEVGWEEKYKKLEEERDNYKTALLTVKGKTLSLGGKKEEKEKKSEWDETSDKFQKETLNKVERLVVERLEKRNEQGAIQRFLKRHPILASNGLAWSSVVNTYKATRGKETVDDILEDLEDAFLVSKRKDGTLDEDLKKAKQEGERKGTVKAKTAQMASVSGAGNHSVSKTDSKKGLSNSAKFMAGKMKTDLKKLEKEDDSTTAVIKF